MTWGSQNTEKEAHEQLSYALDRGVNFFDTAEVCCPHTQPITGLCKPMRLLHLCHITKARCLEL